MISEVGLTLSSKQPKPTSVGFFLVDTPGLFVYNKTVNDTYSGVAE